MYDKDADSNEGYAQTLAEIKHLAPKVGTWQRQQEEARKAVRDAEAAVLAQAIEAVKPALPALASVLPGPREERGVILDRSPEQILMLFKDGQLGVVSKAAISVTSVTHITPREAMDDWDLGVVLGALLKALEGQRGRLNAAHKLDERAEKLQVVLKLLTIL